MSQESGPACCLEGNKSLHQRRVDVSLQEARCDWSENRPDRKGEYSFSCSTTPTYNTYLSPFKLLYFVDKEDVLYLNFWDLLKVIVAGSIWRRRSHDPESFLLPTCAQDWLWESMSTFVEKETIALARFCFLVTTLTRQQIRGKLVRIFRAQCDRVWWTVALDSLVKNWQWLRVVVHMMITLEHL